MEHSKEPQLQEHTSNGIVKAFIRRTTKLHTKIFLFTKKAKDRKSMSFILPPRFKLQVGVTMVCSGWVNAVFICNDLPELCTDLVAALSSLNVHELTHGCCWKQEERSQTASRVAGGLQDKRKAPVLLDCMFESLGHTFQL